MVAKNPVSFFHLAPKAGGEHLRSAQLVKFFSTQVFNALVGIQLRYRKNHASIFFGVVFIIFIHWTRKNSAVYGRDESRPSFSIVGDCWFSIYWRMIEIGAPPREPAK